MKIYRIYALDNGAHILSQPTIIECANEQEAVKKARQMVGNHEVELWDGNRLIAYLPRKFS